jgi:very-short-patch-repair endonuclease
MEQPGQIEAPFETPTEPADGSASAEPSEHVPGTPRVLAAIERWQRELLDLSRNNRLLYFQPGRAGLAITQPGPAELFDRLANRERRQTIVPKETGVRSQESGGSQGGASPAPTDAVGAGLAPPDQTSPLRRDEIALGGDPARQDTLLYRLRLRARSALLEQGIDVLYVAFGLLEWSGVDRVQRPDGTLDASQHVLSPLLLLPVRLDRESALAPYTLTPLDEHPMLNPALTFQLAATYRITLALPEPDEDGDLDLADTLATIQAQLAQQTDWTIRDEAHLGLFSFTRQAMYADLAATRDRLALHPIVRALAGVPDRLPAITLPDGDRLDDDEQPREIFQVLDADASQRAVLAAIRQGGSLVVQGPPGTGKSQTIANAIAETIAQGKTVLFVSEKLAALKVVAKRLAEVGLGDFCLEAHGHDGDKAATVRVLAAALPDDGVRPTAPAADELSALGALAERRRALNAYAAALHDADTPLRASAFAIHGLLAQRARAPRLDFDLPAIGDLSQERVLYLADLVRQLVPLEQVVAAPEQHPWYGCSVERWSPLAQAQLETTLARLATATDELAERHAAAASRWGLTPERSLDGAIWLVGVLALLDDRPRAPTAWLRRPNLADLIEQARAWDARCQEEQRRRSALAGLYTEGLFELDLPPLIQALERVDVAATECLQGRGQPADRALTGRGAIERATHRALRAISAALEAAADLAVPLELPAPTTQAEAERLLTIADLIGTDPRPEAGWLAPGRLGLLDDLADLAGRQAERAATARAALLARFDESVITAITPALADRIETAYSSWLRSLRPGWYADLGLLRRHLRVGPAHPPAGALDYDAAASAIHAWRELTAAEAWLSAQAPGLASAFGRHYQGARTDWVSTRTALGTVRRLNDLLGDLSGQPSISSALLESDGPPALERPAEALRAALAELAVAFAELGEIATTEGTGYRVQGTGERRFPSPAHRERGQGGTQSGFDTGRPEGRGPVLGEKALESRSLGQGVGPPGRGLRSRPLATVATDLERWLAALAPLWRAADALHTCRRGPASTVADLLAEAHDALASRAFDTDLAAATPALQAALGPLFAGVDTNWQQALAALTWTERLRACFGRTPPESFLAALDVEPAGPTSERADLERAIGRLRGLLQELRASFVEGGPLLGSQTAEQATFVALAGWARARHAALPRLREWIDACALVAELETAGLGGIVPALAREAPPADTWVDAFLRQLFTLWLTWRYEQAPPLEQFRRENHEALVDDFSTLDRRQWRIAAERIAAQLQARRPSRAGDGVGGSEVGLLLRESRKQRRFKPLRRLFAELPNLLPTLKPCLLMSPLSVAQHLGESAITFDLVVFDEASQILPPDAIGAIGRGRQVMVVGDRRQLPPTPFFRVTTIDSADDDPDEEPPGSILDAALNAQLPQHSLLWHYRSRHEHLIAFSNAAFYDGRLRTFPSPRADERVVTATYVSDGLYDRGGSRTNRVEATAVADLVVEHVERQAGLSLGVIAFSEAQMLAILAELEARKRARPELEALLAEEGEHGFFVKNLEQVQGDERDVIIFSVGYGRDADGRLTMSFGPLNAPGGERRLNVAVTRARERVTVVSSIRALDIDLERTSAEGVKQLKRYLEYAERGPEALFGAAVSANGEASSPFEEAVRTALVGRGLDVAAEVGVGGYPVDLAVRDDGQYLLGIECDGHLFAEAATARDRERLRREVLERLGWRIHRVWSTDWIVAADAEATRVIGAVEAARRARDGLDVDETPLAGLKPEDRLHQGHTRPYATMRQETGDRRQETGGSALTSAGEPTARPYSDLLPTPSRGVALPRPPTPSNSAAEAVAPATRPIDAVPTSEIVRAMRAVLETAFAMPPDPLIVAVARQLRYRRTGKQIKTVVGRVLEQQLAAGVLVDVGGNLRLADAAPSPERPS